MKSIEILGMRQARAWDMASLNEFRKFFGLKPHKTFEDMNDDPRVADQLRHLYEHPDKVELYTGMSALPKRMISLIMFQRLDRGEIQGANDKGGGRTSRRGYLPNVHHISSHLV